MYLQSHLLKMSFNLSHETSALSTKANVASELLLDDNFSDPLSVGVPGKRPPEKEVVFLFSYIAACRRPLSYPTLEQAREENRWAQNLLQDIRIPLKHRAHVSVTILKVLSIFDVAWLCAPYVEMQNCDLLDEMMVSKPLKFTAENCKSL